MKKEIENAYNNDPAVNPTGEAEAAAGPAPAGPAPAEGEAEAELKKAEGETDDAVALDNSKGVSPPVEPIQVAITTEELREAINKTEQYDENATKVEINGNELSVTVQNKPNLGGKSKKKQRKPKNKSNKKMKNKQTKKGGKQIKKRSLKRKMKK